MIVVGDSRHRQPSRYLTPSALAALAEAETAEAAAMLGLDRAQVTFLGLEQDRLTALLPQITMTIADRLGADEVDDVFLHGADDGDPDRTAVHGAVLAAASHSQSAARLLAVPVERWRAGSSPVCGVRPGAWFDMGLLANGEVPALRKVATERFEFLKRAVFRLHGLFVPGRQLRCLCPLLLLGSVGNLAESAVPRRRHLQRSNRERDVLRPIGVNGGPEHEGTGFAQTYGVRVPALVISPYVEPGATSFDVMDHC